jgi:hypothetical protein
MSMSMTRFHVLAIGAGFLLAMTEPGLAAKRRADTKTASKSQSRAVPAQPSTIRPYPDRDDPYAYGVNWPGKW